MPRNWWIFTLAMLAVVPGVCFERGHFIGPAGPFFPPAGYGWTLPLTLVLFITGHMLVARYGAGLGWRIAGWRAAGALLLFLLVSYTFLPVLAPRHAVYFGAPVCTGIGVPSVSQLPHAFVLCVLLISSLLFLRLADSEPVGGRRSLLRARSFIYLLLGFVTLAVYGIGVLPFALTGAWVSGTPGSSELMQCRANLNRLGVELARYAQIHEGRLPDGDSLAAIWPNLTMNPMEPEYPLKYFCPAAAFYERNPTPYQWHPMFRGRTIAELRQMGDQPLIICAYHTVRNQPFRKEEWALWTSVLVTIADGGKRSVKQHSPVHVTPWPPSIAQ